MDLIPLWAIAAGMAIFTAWIVKRGAAMKTANDATIVLFLLGMMAVMFLSAVDYLYYPGFTTLYLLIVLNMVSMGVFLLPLLLTIFFGNRQLSVLGKNPSLVKALIVGAAIALAIGSEAFMGWTFSLIVGAVSKNGGLAGAVSALVSSSASYWFAFTMSSEMAITLLLLRKTIPSGIGPVVLSQAAVMFLSPTAIGEQVWSDFAILASSAVMALLFVYMFAFLRRSGRHGSGVLAYFVRVVLALALMMAGILLWLADGAVYLIVLSNIVGMFVYLALVLGDAKADGSGPMTEEVAAGQAVPH